MLQLTYIIVNALLHMLWDRGCKDLNMIEAMHVTDLQPCWQPYFLD